MDYFEEAWRDDNGILYEVAYYVTKKGYFTGNSASMATTRKRAGSARRLIPAHMKELRIIKEGI